MQGKELDEVFTVTIDNTTGKTVIDVEGSDGRSCLETTKALEKVLTGGNVNLLTRVLKQEALSRIVSKAKDKVKTWR